ncbi:STE3-domain-containing protein [Epithele typhae]|uniref:STE3-domain-containing protein n=1 Tax=Epithele typhae TaxID=378194 RepID=UPI002008E5C0|nr:STE3-domain-containing protein [Epithele typhae]KAH9916395.1 STE3-domain-containing protein [Epithele typhae]
MVIPFETQVNIEAAFSLLAFILICIPLYWHLEAWNVGCVLYIFWMGTQNLIQFIDKVVWRDNAINVAPVYCDITTHFTIGSSIGVVCASLVINRRLYHIANISAVSITRADKRRNMITDLAIGVGIPIISMILYFVYQGHRFDILEGVGCIEEYPNTIMSYFLFTAWPIPIGLVSATYCTLTLAAVQRAHGIERELDLQPLLPLMGLAVVEILFTLPLTIYNIVQNLRISPIYVFQGMADLHWGFSRVNRIAAISWRQNPELVKAMTFRATLDRSTGFSSTGSKSQGRVTIPTFVQRRTRRGSLDSLSISDRLSTQISIGDIDEKEKGASMYSPTATTSAGSSTHVGSPTTIDEVEREKELLKLADAAGMPYLPALDAIPKIDFPQPPRRARVRDRAPSPPPPAAQPEMAEREVADVPRSVRPHSFVSLRSHTDDMV